MVRSYWRYMVLLGVMVVMIPFAVRAQGVDNRRIGFGVNLGEPIGFDGRLYFTDQFLLDLVVGYGFSEEAFIIQPSLLIPLRGILDYDAPRYSLVPYFGAGFKTGVVLSGHDDGEGVAAFRFPIGTTWVMKEGRFELSVEFAPGVEFNPDEGFDATGGLGLRYFF